MIKLIKNKGIIKDDITKIINIKKEQTQVIKNYILKEVVP